MRSFTVLMMLMLAAGIMQWEYETSRSRQIDELENKAVALESENRALRVAKYYYHKENQIIWAELAETAEDRARQRQLECQLGDAQFARMLYQEQSRLAFELVQELLAKPTHDDLRAERDRLKEELAGAQTMAEFYRLDRNKFWEEAIRLRLDLGFFSLRFGSEQAVRLVLAEVD